MLNLKHDWINWKNCLQSKKYYIRTVTLFIELVDKNS